MCSRSREPGFQAEACADWRKRLAPEVGVGNAEPVLITQRMVKETAEVACIRRAVAITADGLRHAFAEIPHLRSESALASLLTASYRGPAYGPLAFPPIVGSAGNGATLHYPFNDQPFALRRPLLIDSGATHAGYCADVTRTVPQHGRFDDRRFTEVYRIVLRANALVRRAARPGVTLAQLNEIGWKPILAAGFVRHHGIGHHLGLDVHDPADGSVPLAAGMVITNEPGVYLPDDGFGIRIEDDLLITADGCEELTRAIPKVPAAVERWMRPGG
jgi:Xaa-Pro aminopeptidase